MIELYACEGRINIRLRAIYMGKDICVLVDGGDKPHIGAISLAYSKQQSNNLTLSKPHHKEHIITQELCQTIHNTFGNTACCVCGIHINNITKSEISQIINMARDLTKKLITELKHCNF